MTIQAEAPPLQMDETGSIRISKTRVTLDTVIGAFLDGASPESIAEAYSTLTLTDIYATIAYYLRHRESLDEYLRQRRQTGKESRQHIESKPEHQLFRERLLSRARQQGLRP